MGSVGGGGATCGVEVLDAAVLERVVLPHPRLAVSVREECQQTGAGWRRARRKSRQARVKEQPGTLACAAPIPRRSYEQADATRAR